MKPSHAPKLPPPGTPQYIELLRVPAKPHIIFVTFRGFPRGALIHWGKKDGSACPGPELCPSAVHRGRTDWRGYAAVDLWRGAQHQDWFPYVLEVTLRLYELLRGNELPGSTWKLSRIVNRHGKDECAGELVQSCPESGPRALFPIEPTLYRVFHSTAVLLDVEPHLPARILAEPIKAPPPPSFAQATSEQPKADVSPEDRAATAALLQERKERHRSSAAPPPAENKS